MEYSAEQITHQDLRRASQLMPDETDDSHPPAVNNRRWFRQLSLVIVSATVGGAIVFLALHRAEPPKLLGVAPEKFVPAQTLQLLDGKQQYLGDLDLTTDGVTILNMADAKGATLFMYTTGVITPMLTMYGCHESPTQKKFCSLNVQTEPELSFSMKPPGAKTIFTQGKGWNENTGPFVRLLKLVYKNALPEKPENSVEKLIPSEDVRLVDREHHNFAVLGLSEAGEPSIGLMNREGRLVAILSIGGPGPFSSGPKEWPTLTLFDEHGASRIELDLGPDSEPELSITEKGDISKGDLGSYALDPVTGKEVQVEPSDAKATAIPWLAHPMPRIALPITLVDQRSNTLWRSQ